jgi:YD repeat-containing protein
VHVDRKPAKVLAGGEERKFTYDPQTQMVEVAGRAREVEVVY